MSQKTRLTLKTLLISSLTLYGLTATSLYALSSKKMTDVKAQSPSEEDKTETPKADAPIAEAPKKKGEKISPSTISEDLLKAFMTDLFADVAERTTPSAVDISTTQIIEGRDKNIPQPPPGSPLDEMFKDFFEQMEKSPRRVQSLGTGFIVHCDPNEKDPFVYVVTNYHVIAGAKKVSIILHDKTELDAVVKAIDERTDIALLEVKTGSFPAEKRNLQPIEWGDSNSVRVGNLCLAIGNPFGLGSTVTNGVISNRSRNIGIRGGGTGDKSQSHVSEYVDDFLQHNASINMGNSGGPLFDIYGRVIGVNTAIFSPSGGNVGIGFAIPSNLVKETVDQLIKYGRTRRGWLGVKIQQVTNDMAESFGFGSERGAFVSSVTPKGPAAEAGIEARDLILEFDGKKVNEQNRLQRLVGQTEVGKKVKVKVLRKDKNGKNKEIFLDVAIAEYELPTEKGAPESVTKDVTPLEETKECLGIKLSAIPKFAYREFNLKEDTEGVFIVGVNPDSPAFSLLKRGDVIIGVNLETVKNMDEVLKAVKKAKQEGRKNITFMINHAGEIASVVVKNEDDLKDDKAKDKDKETDKTQKGSPEGVVPEIPKEIPKEAPEDLGKRKQRIM